MKSKMFTFKLFTLLSLVLFVTSQNIHAQNISTQALLKLKSIPAATLSKLKSGQPQEIIVEFNDDTIQLAAAQKSRREGVKSNSRAIINYKINRYSQLKNKIFSVLLASEYTMVMDYENMPMSFIHINSDRGLNDLINQANVKAVYPNEIRKANLVESLPLINHASAAPLGATGAGTDVAILDTGLNYTIPAFGCTSPGVPATCKVKYAEDIAGFDNSLDDNGHGTTMASIITNVAPLANIVTLDVFSTPTASSDALIIAGINRVISLNGTPGFNIQIINMSLGGIPTDFFCSVYDTPAYAANTAGIALFAAAGNDGGSQIHCPANNIFITSVGAVYDANVGAQNFTGICSDATTAADKIACFSNGKDSVDLYAPGALITVNGVTNSGTSGATAFVSGTAALVTNALPASTFYTPTSWTQLLRSRTGFSTSRILINGGTRSRINISSALVPPDNDFSNPGIQFRRELYNSTNINGSKELGEPNHAGNIGGKSIWIKLTNNSDNVKLETYGSNFDTLMAVYSGTTVSGLSLVTSNDDDGTAGGKSSVTLQKSSSTNYYMAIDGKNGAIGSIVMNEQLLPALNDNFNAAQTVIGDSGALVVSSSGSVFLTTIEQGEPLHAGQVGVNSTWYTWTPTISGQTAIDTHGTQFDTLLGLYTGTTVSTLTEIASNDDDGSPGGTSSVVVNVTAGQTYYIAVARKSNTPYTNIIINLNWSTVTNPKADISITTFNALPEPAFTGGELIYSASIINNGPDAARDIIADYVIDASINSNGSLNSGCSLTGNIVSCKVGGIISGSSKNVVFGTFVSLTAGPILSSSVDILSPTPDQNLLNNSASYTSTTIPSLEINVPTLPEWALIILAGLLLLLAFNITRKTREAHV